MGNLQQGRRNLAAAESLIRESTAILLDSLGEDNPTVLYNTNGLGEVLMERGRFDEAERTFEHVLEIRRRVLGDRHEETLWTIGNLGAIHRFREEYADAEEHYRLAFEDRRHTRGIDHPRTANSSSATSSRSRDGTRRRSLFFARLSRATGKGFPEDHPHVAEGLLACGWSLLEQDRFVEAEPMFRRCVQTWSTVSPEYEWYYPFAEAGLGAALEARGRLAAADSHLVAGCRVLMGSLHVPRSRVRFALERLAALCDSLGGPDEAAAWRDSIGALTRRGAAR